MSGYYFVIGILLLCALLVATRRKSSSGKSREYRTPRHGAFKEFVRENEKRDYRAFNGGDYWRARNVEYRNETAPFVDSQKMSGIDAALADDRHGVFGEAATSAIVARAAANDKRHHFILQNVYIPTRTGYTEIDTVLLHETGIFVFETKNISGEISGSMELERWTQVLNERYTHTLYNPIRQNQGHMGALLRQLRVRLENAIICSYVVFSDRCVMKNVPSRGEFGSFGNTWQVIHFGELQNVLGKALARRKSVISPRRLEEWYRALQQCVNVSESVKQAHRESVQKMHRN